MKIQLDNIEQRVIGCLIEKQITTPDQYPLSLNALTNACNQKSNRDPMMNIDEAAVQRTLDGLSKKHLIMEKSGFGSRVPKYQHRFCNTEYGTLKLSEIELAIVCELLVRGAQTPGELRTRASRMATVNDVSEIEAALQTLSTREDGPFVVRLTKEPGRRDARWAHLFGTDPPDQIDTSPPDPDATARMPLPSAHIAAAATSLSRDDRLTQLEQEVRTLRTEIEELKRALGITTTS